MWVFNILFWYCTWMICLLHLRRDMRLSQQILHFVQLSLQSKVCFCSLVWGRQGKPSPGKHVLQQILHYRENYVTTGDSAREAPKVSPSRTWPKRSTMNLLCTTALFPNPKACEFFKAMCQVFNRPPIHNFFPNELLCTRILI